MLNHSALVPFWLGVLVASVAWDALLVYQSKQVAKEQHAIEKYCFDKGFQQGQFSKTQEIKILLNLKIEQKEIERNC